VEVLLFAVGGHVCALPLTHVAEVMRMQPVTPRGTLTAGVLGSAVIRGQPTPVVDANLLLNGAPTDAPSLLLLRVEERRVALAVQCIIGPSKLTSDQVRQAPALLRDDAAVITGIGVRDAELVHVLDAIRLLRHAAELSDEPAVSRGERTA
jgi:purine-binding chemotaxis protein CheW